MVRQLRIGFNVNVFKELKERSWNDSFETVSKISFLKDQKFRVLNFQKNEYDEIDGVIIKEFKCKTMEEYNRLLLFEVI